MSAFTDAQRKEAAFEARVARAKAQMLLDQSVLRAAVQGQSERQTAIELGITWRRLMRIRHHLHLNPKPNQHASPALCPCEAPHAL